MMNRGSIFTRPARFERTTRQHMSNSAFNEWRARDSVLSGANALPLRALAEAAERRVNYISGEGVCVTPEMRQERRKTKRKAARYVKKQTARIKQAYQRGDGPLVCVHVERLLTSFYARYIAYCDAWADLKRRHRPHLYVLAEYAAQLDMNSLEFEAGRMRFERKASADEGSNRPNDYRTITSFRIHHRARQKLVLMVLKACFPNHVRPDQYGVSGRGRKAAVEAVIGAMHDPQMEFVAEVDIKDFFPSIGEEEGCIIAPENALYDMFPFLPKAVIESTVLASRILVSLPANAGLQALSHEFNPRTGVPQGSAVSSFISEVIMSEIITSAETCTHSGCVTIGYADNLAVLGICRDDVNQHVQSLSICARSSQYGAFRLSRSQTTRHKSEGFIYLGYYLKYYEDDGRPMVDVDISDKSVLKLRNRLRSNIERFRPTGYSRRDYILEKADEIAKRVVHWHRSFELCEHAEEKALEVLDNVFEEHPRQRNLLYDHIVDVLSH